MSKRRSTHSYERQLPVIGNTESVPLRFDGQGASVEVSSGTTSIVSGRSVLHVGDEFVYSNDELVEPLQPYPGATLPTRLHGRGEYPVPDQVGEYCSFEEFESRPKFMAQWAHWPDRVKLMLEGRYDEIPPAHFEGIFTLVCNFMCPHCTRRVTRTDWVEGGTWDNNTEIEKRNTMDAAGLKRVLDEVASMRADGQMGIVWGGGDPTANPFTYEAMLYARHKDITASFLTNGVFLEVDKVLDADPILVRISLNCGTEESYRRFHGYPEGWDYFDRVRGKMRELVRRKLERNARTLVGISLIVDDRNMQDVVEAAREIRAVVNDAGPGIDYVIVRPVMNYSHFHAEHAKLGDNTKMDAHRMMDEGGAVKEILDELGIPLVLIKDSFDQAPDESFYEDARCLAYGVAGEIRHNGDVQLCSDSYGNPEYTIGNLFEQSLQEIWTSERRFDVLDRINERECFKTTCPHNSRGHHYNRLFHQVERLRSAGEIERVAQWIEDLRVCTLPLGHSFFI